LSLAQRGWRLDWQRKMMLLEGVVAGRKEDILSNKWAKMIIDAYKLYDKKQRCEYSCTVLFCIWRV
jgi:hypothetical protein